MSPQKNNNETQIALIQQALDMIVQKVDKIDTRLESNFVTKEEFTPIKNIVYGTVGVILLAVITALVALVVIPRT